MHALHEVIELDGAAPQVAAARTRRDPPVVPQADFCLQAGLPHWMFDLADGVRLERSVFVPHGQNTVHVRYRLTGATAPARLRIRPWLDFRPHEGRVASRAAARLRDRPDRADALRVPPRRFADRAADAGARRARRVRRRAAGLVDHPARASSATAATTTSTSAHGPGAFTLMLAPGEDAY